MNYNSVVAGLETNNIPIQTAGIYNMIAKLQLPTISEGQGSDSQVVVTVQQNSSTVYTTSPGQEGFSLFLRCAAGDLLSVALSSSAPVDQPLNLIKCTVAVG